MKNTSLKEKASHSKKECPCNCCKIPLPSNPLNLNKLINEYIKSKRKQLEKYLALYKDDKSFTSAILSKCPICGNKCSHQWHVKENVLEDFHEKLESKIESIKKSKDFEELYNIINSYKIKWIGPLTVYDISLRISAKLEKLPKKMVYLHTGAKIKGYNIDIIEKDCFLKPLQKLEAYEIEDFLCIYKKALGNIRILKCT